MSSPDRKPLLNTLSLESRLPSIAEIVRHRPIENGTTFDDDKTLKHDDAFWYYANGDIQYLSISIADAPTVVPSDILLYPTGKRNNSRPSHPRDINHLYKKFVTHSENSFKEKRLYPAITFNFPIRSNGSTEIGWPIVRQTAMMVSRNYNLPTSRRILQNGSEDHTDQVLKALHYLAKNLGNKVKIIPGGSQLNQVLNNLSATNETLAGPNPWNMASQYNLMVNAVLAEYCHNHRIPVIYRNHKIPANCRTLEELRHTKAYFSPENCGHEMMGLPYYALFSSPLQTIVNQVNLSNYLAHLQNPQNPHYPYPLELLHGIADYQNSLIHNQPEADFSTISSSARYRFTA